MLPSLTPILNGTTTPLLLTAVSAQPSDEEFDHEDAATLLASMKQQKEQEAVVPSSSSSSLLVREPLELKEQNFMQGKIAYLTAGYKPKTQNDWPASWRPPTIADNRPEIIPMEKIRDNWILHLAGHAKIPTLPLPPTLTRYKIEESVLRKIKEKNPNFKFEHIPLSVVDGAQTPPSPTEPTVKKEPESPANKKRKAK